MSFSPENRRIYCADENVRARIREFFGEGALSDYSAIFLAAGTESASNPRDGHPVEELTSWLDCGAEMNRSLWDRDSLICHLDLEYVNFDDHAYPFLNEERIFRLQEPVVEAADEFLASFGLHPLKLMTGRGYHLVWRLTRASSAFTELAGFGRVSASLKHLYATERAPTGEQVTPELGAAFAGLGLVMEFLAHEIKVRSSRHCEVPVELGAIEIGVGPHGREMISLDITEYADPLSSRVIRAPFSVYLKPTQDRFQIGADAVERIPPLVVLPLGALDTADAFRMRHDPVEAAQYAQKSSAAIPDESISMSRLIDGYSRSPLARFHADFYAREHDAPALWPETYDCTPLDVLPPCTRLILEKPNDLLLRPGCAQRVVRVMLSLGWHPRHIAGLIRSKYERDYGWGDQWRGNDPATRADFYARLFSGLLIAGVDDLVDFNCQSAREEGLCFIAPCGENLLRFRSSLLDRKKHERLACRPFNRLFLPEEHL